MSNRGRKLPKPKKPPKPKKLPPQPSPWKLAISVILGTATLVGGIAGVLAFVPRVTPTLSEPADPDDPFTASVTITNTGFIPVRAVIPGIGVRSIGFSGKEVMGDPQGDLVPVHRADMKPRDLGLDERFTFALNDFFDPGKNNLSKADIAVIVDFEPYTPFWHWRREKVFPMFARKQMNGKFYWYAK